MKPLDKLEQKMFEAFTGCEYDFVKQRWLPSHVTTYEEKSRAAAQVAKYLARRAHQSGCESGDIDNEYKETLFTEFLTSEGITE